MAGFRWLQCRRIRPVLWDYASERLSEGPMEWVEKHIAQCGSCKHELDSLRQTQEFLAACRAEDEAAPRSTWNMLRQRLMTETQSSLPDPMFHQAGKSDRLAVSSGVTNFDTISAAWNRPAPRAVWPMYLMTSMAGGFAAVAILAVSYGLMNLHKTAPNVVANTGFSIAENTNIRNKVAPDTNANSELDAQQIVNRVANILKDVQTTPRMITTASETPTNNLVSIHSEKRSISAHNFTFRANQKQARISGNQKHSGPKFHPYTVKPEDRLPEITQVASRSALDHVRPVGNESDESDMYIVGTVQPTSHDEDHNY